MLRQLWGKGDVFLNAGVDPFATDPVILRHLRIASICLILLAFIGSLFLLRAVSWQVLPRILSLSTVVVVSTGALILLRSTLSVKMAAHAGGFAVAVGSAVAAFTSGGLGNVASNWMLLIPLVAGLMGGLGVGIYWTVITALIFTSFLFMESVGIGVENMTPVAFQTSQDRLQQAMQFFTIVVIMLSFLRQSWRSDQQLEEKIALLRKEVNSRKEAELVAYQANRTRSVFLASMSHELRTPLNSIIGFSRHLLKRHGDNPDSQEFQALDSIYRNGEKLLQLISDLLDLAKIETGKLPMQVDQFDIHALLQDTLINYRELLETYGLTLHNRCQGAQQFQGDMSKMRQVFSNLVGNAIDVTDKGRITIWSEIVASDDSDNLVFHFQDSGGEVDVSEFEQVFENFSPDSAAPTKRCKNSALGLVLSDKLVKLHAGKLGVANVAGQGCDFMVSLPLQERIKKAATLNL